MTRQSVYTLLILVVVLSAGTLYRYRNSLFVKADAAKVSAITFATEVGENFRGKEFPSIALREVLTDSSYTLSVDGYALLILISKSYDCNPCTIRELGNLDSLTRFFKGLVKIYAIFSDADRTYPLMLRKVSQAQFPFLYSSDALLEQFNAQHRFPLLLFLKGHKVQEALFPIPANESFSREWFVRVHSRLKSTR